MSGERVLEDLALSELTTIGALQRRVAQYLKCAKAVLLRGSTVLAPPDTPAEYVLSNGGLIHAIVNTSTPNASAECAVAFILHDHSVVAWGDADYGGNSEEVKEALSSGVQHIYYTRSAFAAVKADGSVVTWGYAGFGGNSEVVKEALTSGVQHIYSTNRSFAAVKACGSVVTWGCVDYGGTCENVKDAFASGV